MRANPLRATPDDNAILGNDVPARHGSRCL